MCFPPAIFPNMSHMEARSGALGVTLLKTGSHQFIIPSEAGENGKKATHGAVCVEYINIDLRLTPLAKVLMLISVVFKTRCTYR